MHWYAIRTNIRCEARAARALRAAGIAVYVPKMRKAVWNRRKSIQTVRYLPLMVRYIFVRFRGIEDWMTLRACDGVESVLGIAGTPYAIPRATVASVMRTQRSGEFDDVPKPKPQSGRQRRELARARFRRGQKVAVLNSAFSGFAAHVDNIDARGVIKVMISIFGRLTPIEVSDLEQLREVDEAGEAA